MNPLLLVASALPDFLWSFASLLLGVLFSLLFSNLLTFLFVRFCSSCSLVFVGLFDFRFKFVGVQSRDYVRYCVGT